MPIESHQPLLKPVRLGNLDLPNRVVMAPLTRMRAATGHQDTVVPRPMDRNDIRRTVADFGRAAQCHRGRLDGVQIQGGYHYLFNQFLNIRTNLRTDEYGGATENRARFLFEVVETVVEAVVGHRTGIKTGPATSETGAFVSTDETLATSEYVFRRLNDFSLSHLLLMGGMADLSATPLTTLAWRWHVPPFPRPVQRHHHCERRFRPCTW